jgi:peroxiredoxin
MKSKNKKPKKKFPGKNRSEPKTMIKSKKQTILSWIVQIAIAALLILGVTTWQARHLLDKNTDAPQFELESLSGKRVSLSDYKDKKVVLYFFAPWGTVCNYSSSNLVALRNSKTEDELAIIAICLGYEHRSEVKRFADEHHLNMPVLLGTQRVSDSYKITSFPTVYILDKNHRIYSKTVGYTTEMGLRLRAL